MLPLVVLVPLAAGVACFAIRWQRARLALLLAVAVAQAALPLHLWLRPPAAAWGGWLRLDAAGQLFLSITAALFLAVAVYAVGYLQRESADSQSDVDESGRFFTNAPEAVLVGGLLIFLAMMNLVCVSANLGLLWVAVEATTLASAPLIYFHRHHRSLEAAWKYLLICSVGIALALMGTFLLGVAATHTNAAAIAPSAGAAPHSEMVLGELIARARSGLLNPIWLKAAFLFLLVGYGTKMGLAPFHTWLPDAHSESPSMVSALLSGALLNCAFLGILRGQQILAAAGLAEFGQQLLVIFGLLSMTIAAIFIVGQADFKRMLAYSSVEHMGILSLGVGLGGGAAFGAMLHAVNHSLAKAMLFLLAGNILATMRTKKAADVTGLARTMPLTGGLWLAGFLAICASPPFGTFLSELTILRGAIVSGRWFVAAGYLLLLGVVFVGMAAIVLRMVQGSPRPTAPAAQREPAWSVVPAMVLCVGVLVLGLYVPAWLRSCLDGASALVTGAP